MDQENKIKFDEVLHEFKSRLSQSGYDQESDHCVKPSELFANSTYVKMLVEVTEERPMIVAGEVSDMLKHIRETMSEEVSNRVEIIFNLLGTDITQQEENFKKLSRFQRWLFKGYMYASACLEYLAFGASKLYKKVVSWIKEMNMNVGYDIFNIPDKLPSMDEAIAYVKDKLDLEKHLRGVFNPI